jgi:hypothetical protein
MRLQFLFFPLCLLWLSTAAQPGCPDPQALNFDAAAMSNDGSCVYPVTNYTPVFVANLSDKLQEISGFTQAGSTWWGHNDSGADADFYNINPETGGILQTIKLQNAQNRDWEDIAAEAENLYLGDFGNNNNNRQNLGIYLVPRSSIGNSNSETVNESEWSFLPFSYNDQTDFSSQPEDSSVYDCEAMIIQNGKIHLFTKSRRHYNSSHYVVNAYSNEAEKTETFDTQGLITGASISPDGKLIALIGYDLRPFIPTVFCWLLWDWPSGTDLFFAGNKRRIELGTALQVGQVESIGFGSNRAGYITNEVTKFNGVTIVPESVRSVDFSLWVPVIVSSKEPAANTAACSVFPNPFAQTVQFQCPEFTNLDSLQVKNQSGQTVLRLKQVPNTLELGFLPAGMYTFETWRNGKLVGTTKGLKR